MGNLKEVEVQLNSLPSIGCLLFFSLTIQPSAWRVAKVKCRHGYNKYEIPVCVGVFRWVTLGELCSCLRAAFVGVFRGLRSARIALLTGARANCHWNECSLCLGSQSLLVWRFDVSDMAEAREQRQ